MLAAHEELPDPIAYLRVREGIITVWLEPLEAYLAALHAIPPAGLHEETLFQMTMTSG
jgi:hypothetical protein